MPAQDAHAVEISHLEARLGQQIGTSAWRTVDQQRINAFADATDDWQFIHVDPDRARAALAAGGTIAHGFLVLSLLSAMAAEAVPPIRGLAMGMNYGFDKVRFVSPVPSGARIRARFLVRGVERAGEGRFRVRYDISIDIEGQGKPALVAEWIVLLQLTN